MGLITLGASDRVLGRLLDFPASEDPSIATTVTIDGISSSGVSIRKRGGVCVPLKPVEITSDCDCCCCNCCCDCEQSIERLSAPPVNTGTTYDIGSAASPSAESTPRVPLEPAEVPPGETVWGESGDKHDASVGIFFDGFGQDGTATPLVQSSIYLLYKNEYPKPPRFNCVKDYYGNFITDSIWDWPSNPAKQALAVEDFLVSLPGAISRARRNVTRAYELIQREFCKHVSFNWLNANDRYPIATLCSDFYVDIFGYSWGAVEALELAWQLKQHPLRCKSDSGSKVYMVQYTPAVRFLGVISPVDTFINGEMPDEMDDIYESLQGVLGMIPLAGEAASAHLRAIEVLCKASAAGWSMPNSWQVPDNVLYAFSSYCDPRIPNVSKLFALPFQYQKKMYIPQGKNISNSRQSNGKPGWGEYTYRTNHEYAGGWSNGGISMCNDLWYAWGFAAKATHSPEAAAYRPPSIPVANSTTLKRYPWASDPRIIYDENSYKWTWRQVERGMMYRDQWEQLADSQHRLILLGEAWPYGNPSVKPSFELPWFEPIR